MAKVRPARDCLAAGGGGWGKGRSSKRSRKAPKSSFCINRAFLLRRRRWVSARITIPATPTPMAIQVLGWDEAFAFTASIGFHMTEDGGGSPKKKKDGRLGSWKGFSKVLEMSHFWAFLFWWKWRNVRSCAAMRRLRPGSGRSVSLFSGTKNREFSWRFLRFCFFVVWG